ncbi:MAG: UDP-N-acetylmuramoyl-L-alanine--D-glutamate ligase [Myxococcota bacterium]
MTAAREQRAWAGRRVLIMGLGTKDGGVGAAKFFASRGAHVVVTDRAPAAELRTSLRALAGLPIRYRLGTHAAEDFRQAEVVIRNVGIPRDHPLLTLARKHGAVVHAPIGVLALEAGRPWIGITGSKGKSLTTSLVAQLLGGDAAGIVEAGNNCVSPLRVLDRAARGVFELSSWQLAELGSLSVSPRIACMVSFFADHQDFYPGLAPYFADKAQIAKHQRAGDTLVVPLAPWTASLPGNAPRFFFGRGEPSRDGCFEYDAQIWWRENERTERIAPLDHLPKPLRDPHHRLLLLAALACGKRAGVTTRTLAERIPSLSGLPHRMERCGRRGEVAFINDSAATTPESTALALKAVSGRVVLIAGGGGAKERSYAELARFLWSRASGVVVFSEDEVGRQLRALAPRGFPLRVCGRRRMNDAVAAAVDLLGPAGGTVLLSPGCKGGPTFRDMYERGDLFRAAAS